MSKVRRIDWSPSEWLAGTRGVGMDETAVYITVLNIIYDRGGECPNDADWIAGQFGTQRSPKRDRSSAVLQRVREALATLIRLGKLNVTHDGHGLSNARAEIELSKASERIVGAARAGVASGASRRASGPAVGQRWASGGPAAQGETNKNKDLTRTPVRIINHHYESSSSIFTDAARDPAQVGGSGPRASRPQTMKERMAALAALNRRKFLA